MQTDRELNAPHPTVTLLALRDPLRLRALLNVPQSSRAQTFGTRRHRNSRLLSNKITSKKRKMQTQWPSPHFEMPALTNQPLEAWRSTLLTRHQHLRFSPTAQNRARIRSIVRLEGLVGDSDPDPMQPSITGGPCAINGEPSS